MSCILLLEPQTVVDEESLNEIYNNTSGENSHDTETTVGDELYVFPAVISCSIWQQAECRGNNWGQFFKSSLIPEC